MHFFTGLKTREFFQLRKAERRLNTAKLEWTSSYGTPIGSRLWDLFLTVSNGTNDPQILGWAINQLHTMKSPRADAELERYAREIERLAKDSRLRRDLEPKRLQIRNLLPPRQ